jgi:hypothetical protein
MLHQEMIADNARNLYHMLEVPPEKLDRSSLVQFTSALTKVVLIMLLFYCFAIISFYLR